MNCDRRRLWTGVMATSLSLGGVGCTVGWESDVTSFTFRIGLLALVAANLLYFLWRREDNPGELRRAMAFFAGLPFTFLTFLLVEPDGDASNRRVLLEEMKDDPIQVEADFQRELARVHRLRSNHGHEHEEAEGPPRTASNERSNESGR